jgi:hypothetical protein
MGGKIHSSLVFAHRQDLKSGTRQRLDDTFRNLFGLLRFHSAIRVILAGVGNCSCNPGLRKREPVWVLCQDNGGRKPLATRPEQNGAGGLAIRRTLREALSKMTDDNDPFHDLDVQEAIDLRWTLRDVRAKRWKLLPINPSHLEKLKSMGLVEMRDDDPVLTNAGIDAIP